jgi:hypothetical protein
MNILCLNIFLIISFYSITQIKFDSCIVFKNYQNHGLKEGGLKFEFKEIEKNHGTFDNLSDSNCLILTAVINRAQSTKLYMGKLTKNLVFLKCFSSEKVFQFVLSGSRFEENFVLIDASNNKKYFIKKKEDNMFLKKIYDSYSYHE